MLMRIFTLLIILIAVIIGILIITLPLFTLPREQMLKLLTFRDFFDVTLPILIFGALVKYLCSPCLKCDACHKKKLDSN